MGHLPTSPSFVQTDYKILAGHKGPECMKKDMETVDIMMKMLEMQSSKEEAEKSKKLYKSMMNTTSYMEEMLEKSIEEIEEDERFFKTAQQAALEQGTPEEAYHVQEFLKEFSMSAGWIGQQYKI